MLTNEDPLALLQVWSSDPSLMREAIRESRMLLEQDYEVQIFLIEDGADMGFINGVKRACLGDDKEAEALIQDMDNLLDDGVTILICNKSHNDRIADERYGATIFGIGPESFYQYISDHRSAALNLMFQGMSRNYTEKLMDLRIKANQQPIESKLSIVAN